MRKNCLVVFDPNSSLSSWQELELGGRLLLALVMGTVIGLEREYHGHSAGLRTMGVVALGSCLFTILGLIVFPGKVGDPTRIAAQVVTGIGFLGAGTILRNGDRVGGLTSAASIWVVAAIGMAAGFGFIILCVLTTILVLLPLLLMRPLEEKLFGKEPSSRRRLRRKTDEQPSSGLGPLG